MSFPVTLHFKGRLAVVVGGGAVALRKAAALHASGARLRVIAREASDGVMAFCRDIDAELRERAYAADDLDGALLVVTATGDPAVDTAVGADAARRSVLVCDAAEPGRGDVTMPSVVRVGELVFGIDTGGAAPAFAKRVAGEVRDRFDERYGRAAAVLAGVRAYVKTLVPAAERAAVLRALAALPIDRLAGMNPLQAEHEADEIIEGLRMQRGRNGVAPGGTISTLVCASRGSALALVQTRSVAAQLARRGVATTILSVTTTGDRVQDRSLVAIGAESLFVKELELALRDKRADYAVHSCKDLPSTLPGDMVLTAISAREDARDVFCSERFASLGDLPPGARVGTSSLRRRAQLAALRSDLAYVDVRGNVDTRLRKLRDGQYEALVLAGAGLRRLGAGSRYMVPFALTEIVPATGQGALAVETRADDAAVSALVRACINDEQTELAVTCERAALRALQGGCQAPIGIHAHVSGTEMTVDGVIASLDGLHVVRERASARVGTAEDAELLGSMLASALLQHGAQNILDNSPRPHAPALAGTLVVLARTQEHPSRIAEALRADGADVREIRLGDTLDTAVDRRTADVLIFPSSGSVAAAHAFLRTLDGAAERPLVAAMGPASAAAARAAGFSPDIEAPEASIDALVTAVRAHLLQQEHHQP